MNNLFYIRNSNIKLTNIENMEIILNCPSERIKELIQDYSYIQFKHYIITCEDFMSKVKEMEFFLAMKGLDLEIDNSSIYGIAKTKFLRIIDHYNGVHSYSFHELYKKQLLSKEEINYIYSTIKENFVKGKDYETYSNEFYFDNEVDAYKFCNEMNYIYKEGYYVCTDNQFQ
jgi:hypothetical protein